MPRHCFSRLMHRSTVLRRLYASWSKAGGRPPRLPRRRRWPCWSAGTGITARMPRLLKWSGMAREEYASSARTTSGLVRGRPRRRGTRRRPITSTKAGASPACPAVSTKAGGRQLPSAARWIFVVSPPRERPMAWSPGSPAGAPFASPGRVLMNAHDRGVNRDDPVQVAVSIGLGEQHGEHTLPSTIDGPVPQPRIDALPRAVLGGQVHPLRPGPELPGDRIDHLSMITPPPAPPQCPIRQQRLYPRPLRVSQRHGQTDDPMIGKKRPRRRPGPSSPRPPAGSPRCWRPGRSRRGCLRRSRRWRGTGRGRLA